MTMFTVTDDILNAELDVVVPAGARIGSKVLAHLHDTHGIDRVQLNGQWYLIEVNDGLDDSHARRRIGVRPE
jgi:hypothetical protein